MLGVAHIEKLHVNYGIVAASRYERHGYTGNFPILAIDKRVEVESADIALRRVFDVFLNELPQPCAIGRAGPSFRVGALVMAIDPAHKSGRIGLILRFGSGTYDKDQKRNRECPPPADILTRSASAGAYRTATDNTTIVDRPARSAYARCRRVACG